MPENFSELISLNSPRPQAAPKSRSILLLRPPYFTPWTPPLGIAILKSFLNSHGHRAKCFDFNADPELWGMHHRYFSVLAASNGTSTNDGYSKLWWIINAHMLAYANGAGPAAQRRLIESISPLYGVHVSRSAMDLLLPLIERYFSRLTHIFDQLDLSGYDVVGTSTYTTSLSSSLWLLDRAKKKHPGLTTVMGGGVFADDLALGSENLQILLEEYPWLDHVILGEGELLLQKLLDGSLAHKRVLALADLNGATLKMEDVPTPDFSDFDLTRYYNLTIEGARSCPFQCSFCSETIQWGEYRKKPIDKFVEQITEMVKACGMREVFLGDSLMNPYLIPFADALIKQGTNILYDGYLRADRPVTKDKFVQRWAESGLYRVRLGIESASDRVLKSMAKMTTAAVISDVLKTLSKAGIRTTTYWIVGYPGETEEDFEETCDFIRAHHQYIYELEAHPYYYYPYGQVGSRLHQCESTYAEEVTNLTKFKVWEIIGAHPPREVRYQRLDRISQLSAELGLPNIYTMTERYQAEDRWRALHPFAREVFKNSDAAPEPVEHSSPAAVLHQESEGGDPAVICYRVSAAKRLDADTLGRALAEITGHYPMLRDAVAPVRQFEAADSQDEATIINNLGAELAQDAAVPVRIALRHRDAGASDLLLAARHQSVDALSLTLIAESLCRVYEQVAAGKPVYLRPEEKPYSEYVRGHHSAPEAAAPVAGSLPMRSMPVTLSAASSAGLSPAAGRRREAHIRFLTASLRVLGQAGIHRVGVRVDPRVVDPSVAHTVGPVCRIVSWPQLGRVQENVGEALEAVSIQLEKSCTGHHADPQTNYQALIDLEYLVEPAWMGAADWQAGGFALEASQPAFSSDIQLSPQVTAQGIEVRMLHGDTAGAQAMARDVAGRLDGELALVAGESDAMRRAELFWHEELGYAGEPLATAPRQLAAGPLEAVAVDVSSGDMDLRAALVAIYALLAPRLDNIAVSRIALLYADGLRLQYVPLRMHESGNPKCVDFIRIAGEKMALARVHSRRSEAVLRKMKGKAFAAHACLQDATADPYSATECNTILDLRYGALAPQLLFRAGLYRREQIEELAGALSSVLTQIIVDPELRIGDVLWGNIQRTMADQAVEVAELSHEFQFGD